MKSGLQTSGPRTRTSTKRDEPLHLPSSRRSQSTSNSARISGSSRMEGYMPRTYSRKDEILRGAEMMKRRKKNG